jgi:hypothetical protein
MNSVGKLPPIKTGTPSTIVMNRQNFHLNLRILGCMGSVSTPGVTGTGNCTSQSAVKQIQLAFYARITLWAKKIIIFNFYNRLGYCSAALVMRV